MLTGQKVQLDTTVQVSRFTGDKVLKTYIEELLDKNEAFVSRYVLFEYKRTLIKDCILLYSLVEEEQDIDEGIARYQKMTRLKPRQQNRLIDILRHIFKEYPDNLKKFLIRLERYISVDLINRFEFKTKYIDDNVGCYPSGADPRDPAKFLEDIRCTKGMARCGLKRFLSYDKKQKALKKYIEISQNPMHKENEEIQRVGKTCQKVLDNIENAEGRNCMILGDMIITLETPDENTIITTNEKDFAITTASVKKTYESIHPDNPS